MRFVPAFLLLIATWLLPQDSAADQDAQMAALGERVAEFSTIFESGEIGKTLDFLPPRIITALTKDSGVSKSQMAIAMQLQWDELTETIVVEKFSINMDEAELVEAEDIPTHALIPTSMRMGVVANPDRYIEATSETLAIYEDDQWFLVRLQQAELVDMFNREYPQFSGVNLSPEQMTIHSREGGK